MSATVWGKFFWSDWRSDPGLRACSYAARGLWMDMLCIAAEADPKGYVLIAGRACDARAIARVTGGQVEEVEVLVAELEEHGVFSRDGAGIIFSRRMVADTRRGNAGPKYRGSSAELPLETPKRQEGESPPRSQRPETRSQTARVRAGARARLPDDWNLSLENIAYAKSKGFQDREIADMCEAFRDHHRHKATLGLDWDGAWRTWCRNEIKFSRNRPGGSGKKTSNGFAAKAYEDMMEELDERTINHR